VAKPRKADHDAQLAGLENRYTTRNDPTAPLLAFIYARRYKIKVPEWVGAHLEKAIWEIYSHISKTPASRNRNIAKIVSRALGFGLPRRRGRKQGSGVKIPHGVLAAQVRELVAGGMSHKASELTVAGKYSVTDRTVRRAVRAYRQAENN
jgi:hypothetical protein